MMSAPSTIGRGRHESRCAMYMPRRAGRDMVQRVPALASPHQGNRVDQAVAGQISAPPRGLIAMQGFDREAYEERAAVMEFDGGLPREQAQRLAAMEQLYPDFWRDDAPDAPDVAD